MVDIYLLMNTIQKITRQELISEAAGISFIVRKWAKILEKEVKEQVDLHDKEERAKLGGKTGISGSEKSQITSPKYGKQSEIDFPEEETEEEDRRTYSTHGDLDDPEDDNGDDININDPFYWKDETGHGKGSKNDDFDWDDEEYWRHRKQADKGDWNEGGDWKKKFSSYYKGKFGKKKDKKKEEKQPTSYGGRYSNTGYGGYGSYVAKPYIPPLDEVTVFGDNFPEEYKEFAVDMWVLKNSGRIEYDHNKSGYADSGEYIVYMNIPLAGMSESAFIHEIKHAYDDWNRMRHGGKPIKDTWEIKNIYTKDFEKLILGGSNMFTQLAPIIRNFYLGSKLEIPAYLENEYDNAMVDYEGVAKSLMRFNISNYLNKQGEPAKGLEAEFERLKRYDIPLFKKFKNVIEFLTWTQKYFNKRGRDIFGRIAKMRYVHNRPKPTYTPKTYTSSTSSYKKPEEKDDDAIGDWVYSPEKGWHEKEEKSITSSTPKSNDVEDYGDWKFSKERGWYYDPNNDDEPWY